MTLHSVNTFSEEGSLETRFWARLEKKLLKMEQFFVSLKTVSFLSLKTSVRRWCSFRWQVNRFYGFPKFFRFIYFFFNFWKVFVNLKAAVTAAKICIKYPWWSLLLRELQHVESPLFWTKRCSKYILLGIYKIFNITNSKYLDCQIWFQ